MEIYLRFITYRKRILKSNSEREEVLKFNTVKIEEYVSFTLNQVQFQLINKTPMLIREKARSDKIKIDKVFARYLKCSKCKSQKNIELTVVIDVDKDVRLDRSKLTVEVSNKCPLDVKLIELEIKQGNLKRNVRKRY